MATTLEKPRRRRGRPTREEEMARTLAELGVDPALIDPKRILAAIACDTDAAPSARVAAAKALLGQRDRGPVEVKEPGTDKAEARTSKKAVAARAAATAGLDSDWGEDLLPASDWPPQ
jgi:hypothetical protein